MKRSATMEASENKRRRDRARYQRNRDAILAHQKLHRQKSREEPPVSVDYVRSTYVYDESSGRLTYRVRVGPFPPGKEAGSIKGPAIRVSIKSRSYGVHRIAWLYVHGVWPTGQIDHMNGNPLDNRLANLRDVTETVNHQNLRKAPAGKKYSPLFGAQWCKQAEKWKSSIKVNGRLRFLGFFESDEAASKAYVQAKRGLHEGCTI